MEGVEQLMAGLSFYKGKRVFVTGHTGFKGSWLCRMLVNSGADVTGYSLAPPTTPNLFSLSGVKDSINSVTGDIRDFQNLKAVFDKAAPEIVFHLAAQPIVREGYDKPVLTYETNVMGTVNLLECARQNGCVRSLLNVTTDKVYENRECDRGYRENDTLDGYDPYSNSKSCSELVTHCYRKSFFSGGETAVSTARAGNVIGGGDFAASRIIPDCIRAAKRNRAIALRSPLSVRPYQHVLEPLYAYLMIAAAQYGDGGFAGYYNVGPDDCDCVTTGELADIFCKKWGNGLSWTGAPDKGPHEAGLLKLDCSRLKAKFGWKPRWHIDTAVEKTVEWTKTYFENGDIPSCMDSQIVEFMSETAG